MQLPTLTRGSYGPSRQSSYMILELYATFEQKALSKLATSGIFLLNPVNGLIMNNM